jgi:mono/diheme cytochrome c family protein
MTRQLSRGTKLQEGRRVAAALSAAAAILWLSACGGAPPPTGPEPNQGGDASGLGRRVFLSQCQGCHAIGGLGARRPVGGDLGNYDMSPAEVASFARIMPTPRRLTDTELAAVSSFVAALQERSASGPRSSAKEPR